MHASSPALSRPRRILHVIFSRRLAGAERYCADLANRQAAAGDEIHVLGMPGAMIERALHANVRFHALRLPRLLRGWQLRRLAERLGVELAHAHLSPACKALARVPELAGVATLHVGYKAHQHRRLDGLVCVNHAQHAQLAHYGGLSRTISNWLPLPVGPVRAAGSLRQELGLAPETFIVGAVGRLDASKGMDLLVSAFKASAPASAALVIIGEGSQRAELERLRGGDGRIHLPGFRADVQSALADFDLFVSPSREETFGLALLEAMAAGLPVLASAAEGPRELLRGQPAQLVAPGSLYELGAALSSTFARRGAAASRSPVSYDLTAFEPHRSLAQMAEFYGQVLAQRTAQATKQQQQQRSRPTTERPVAIDLEAGLSN